ncbi:MAG: glycosyltransferase family 4 protein [Ardenticatenaceae bacterium]|nr:glycosyltransferase family 4 protein [Anaerolineales bacterium]MCB8922611.1 glycosyltransferase family 4 protein [Ardenticatenaceae bacterium]MCB8991279.1 glycosyltransferase family 4 protein [Ardenticatenaceae bacterium]MCB9003680.1 glycosyltransferase family 4 protein [Ardenticatenaceae bacterium]
MASSVGGDETPLRILMIAPTSFFSDYGGHIRILEETRNLQALGHQVTIVTYYKGDDLPGLDIRRTAPLPWHTDYEVGSSRHKIAFDSYLAAQSFVEALRVCPDVIHGHMHEGALIGGVLSRLLRVPLVFDFQGSLTGEMVDHKFLDPNGKVYPWVHRLERTITRLPQAILTSSVQARELLQNEFRVPVARIHPLPDCADTVRFDPQKFSPEAQQTLRRRLQIPLDRQIVVYLGLLTDYQGIPHLLEAGMRLVQAGENVHLLVMGYPNVQHYQHMALQLGLGTHITFTGKVEYRDAPLYLSLGDVAVAPKMSATEGSGKVLNYMAMAQPVVAYDTAVHREYLVDLGVYASPGDVAGFAQAIANLLHDPNRRAVLGQNLRERAIHHYSWANAAAKIIEIYKMLTGQ